LAVENFNYFKKVFRSVIPKKAEVMTPRTQIEEIVTTEPFLLKDMNTLNPVYLKLD
jgi:hypothetical protein